jgi:UDP-N-acetylmuramoylalanine--D-glutamate ligase
MMREPPFKLLSRPSPISLHGKRVLVLGLGDTGLSVARWVEREGGKARVADTRAHPPRVNEFSGELRTGPFTSALLDEVDLICISPGLALDDAVVQEGLGRGLPVVGDVELFAWRNRSAVLAVTGTNGKTTVTALTGHLLRAAGIDVEVAGNIAPPVLDALARRATPPAAWVLELSSYQLETTWSLAPRAAAVLNLSEDHLDRYPSVDAYAAAKSRILLGARLQVLNRNDPRSLATAQPGSDAITFGLDEPVRDEDFGLSGKRLLHGKTEILNREELQIHGLHNVANALAACALARSLGISHLQLAAGLRSFRGLPHRLECVAVRRGVEWYDDSKGTNVGATIAALRGLGRQSVLILGGEGKGQDFSPLAAPVAEFCTAVLLIGRDAPRIEKALGKIHSERCASLEQAVERAAAITTAGQAVLLSPACASFDMFRDYRHRGEVFAATVKGLAP